MSKHCDHHETNEGKSRCRKTARTTVMVRLFARHDRDVTVRHSIVERCWPHYLELEQGARDPGVTYEVRGAEIIKP